jgi:dipeptidyl aminopeptidase/acylaminoacyl peptidase
MARPPQPDDLSRFLLPTDPVLSPDGAWVAFTVQRVARRRDGYRHAIWLVPADGSTDARQVTLGAQHDVSPRFSPDGRFLALLSDRRGAVEDEAPAGKATKEHLVQVHLLPLAGGEARRLTDLPQGVTGFAWAPDGRRLVAWSSSREAAAVAAAPTDDLPESDYHYVDRLGYLFNGRGYVYHRRTRLWLVDASTGAATRLTDGETDEAGATWSPDGTRIAFAANRRPDPDLREHQDVFVADAASRAVTQITGGDDAAFFSPAWLPDGRTLAVLGHRFTANAGTRSDLWLFAADGSDSGPSAGRNLTARHDRMLAAGIASDLTPNEEPRIRVSADGAWLTVLVPDRGAYELARVAVKDGRLEQLTTGHHVITAFDQVAVSRGRERIAYVQSDPTRPSEIFTVDVGGGEPRRVTRLNDDALTDIALVEPVERLTEVDGRQIQGWLFPAAGGGPGAPPLVTQIHGGPHAFYAWAPTWEFQVLAGAGMSVYASNPRGSDGYGEAFNAANYRDWGTGPMRDVLAGIDALVADGRADPARLGLTGGSYGGYLTTWIVAHDRRFRAALTARSVSDMTMLMLTGDISGGEFGRLEFGVTPWDDPTYYREISPITYAAGIRTPLLIQHSEQDLRTTIAQAEALFTVLRSLRRPVRLMRVPEETHELTRSGTPFRRVENLVQVRDWFAWYLVRGRRSLPPIPKVHGGR